MIEQTGSRSSSDEAIYLPSNKREVEEKEERERALLMGLLIILWMPKMLFLKGFFVLARSLFFEQGSGR